MLKSERFRKMLKGGSGLKKSATVFILLKTLTKIKYCGKMYLTNKNSKRYFMKKINLKFLSGALGLITLFPTAPVKGLDYSQVGYDVYPVESVNDPIDSIDSNDSIDIKSIAEIGVSGLLTAGAIAGICEAAKDRSPFVAHDYSKLPNANFTNTANLCFWHALVQQLYDIKAFRKFIDSVDLSTIANPNTRRKIEKFRELFADMARFGGENYSRFTKHASYNMAKEFLPIDSFGRQQDINEACNLFLSDVFDEYTKCYGRQKVGQRGTTTYVTNILMESVKLPVNNQQLKLGDLLKESEANFQDKLNAMEDLWGGQSNPQNKVNRMPILQRLPITEFLARVPQNGDEPLVFNNGAFVIDDKFKHLLHTADPNEPNSCSMDHFSDLPWRLRNYVIQSFENDPVRPYILSNQSRLQQIRADWDSTDLKKKKAARQNLLENLPIGDFLVGDANGRKGRRFRTGFHLDLPALEALINGGGTFDQAVRLLKKSTRYKTPLVKATLGALPASEVDINVLDDQFSIFVGRFQGDAVTVPIHKVHTHIDFGNGTVDYKGQKYELTAVSVHKGLYGGGHYYTYKKQNGYWYKYDDIASGYSGEVTWDAVKADSETNCTMMTFSKQGTVAKGRSPMDIRRVEPLNITRNYISNIISKAEPNLSKYRFEIVQTRVTQTDGTIKYPSGIVDQTLLSNPSYGQIAIVDAANVHGLGGGGVDGAIFTAMNHGVQYPPGQSPIAKVITAKMPCYDNSKIRIKEGGAIIHRSYGIGAAFPDVPYVIQTVSPQISSEKDLPLFYSAWYNAVHLGIASGCDTLFIPGIGMGVFCKNQSARFAKKCARVAAQAMKDAINNYSSIKIVIIDHQDNIRNAAFFDELKQMIH